MAVVFVVALFFIKNKNIFNSTVKYLTVSPKNGLTYDPNETVADLINKSTTGDGIPDWEKILLGLDPNKTENVPGVPDSVTIQKMIQANGANTQTNTNTDDSNLSQTDQVSREFFATVTSLEESGAIDANGNMDQATQDQITNSLINSIQNTPQRKIYTLNDIKIINDHSAKALKKYADILHSFYPKNQANYTVMDVLQKFAPDDTGNNANSAILSELDPIVKQFSGLENGMLNMQVPQPLASVHLDIINAIEGVVENLNDVQQYSTDPIVAFSGMSKYQADADLMNSMFQKLITTIKTTSWKNQ